MVLISVTSVETDNGYQFANDFAESVIINPKSKVSLINFQFERKLDFVVLEGGNQFKVRVGDKLNSLDIVGIDAGTYTATSLAFAIQEALNNFYGRGHNFECFYTQKDNLFNLIDRYKAPSLPITPVNSYAFGTPQCSGPNVVGYVSTGLEFGVNNVATPKKTGVVNNTSQYVLSNELIETKNAPNFANGGSSLETTILVTELITPPVPQNTITSYGIVIGLTNSKSGDTLPASRTFPIATDDLSWLEVGMVFSTIQSGKQTVKFIEAGVDIGGITGGLPFEILNEDTYRIILSTDGLDNASSGYPVYQYKRKGATWKNFNTSQSNPRLSWRAWNSLDLRPVIGTDYSETGKIGPKFQQSMSLAGGGLGDPVVITAGNTNLRLKDHKLDIATGSLATFTRTVDAGANYATTETGYITQNVPAGDYSEINFNIKPATTAQDNGDFYIAVIDSNQRTLNQLQLGITDNLMGSADPAYGNFVGADNLTKIGVATQNPAMVVYRFVAWNDIATTGEIVSKNKIYKRHDMNQYNLKGGNLINLTWDLVGDIADDDKDYTLKVYGSSNKCELCLDGEVIDSEMLPREDRTGIKSIAQGDITNGVTKYATDATGAVFTIGGTKGAVIRCDTDANGDLTGTPEILNSGAGYEAGQGGYAVVQFDETTGQQIGSGNATVAITALTNTPPMGYGTSFDKNKTYQGYGYWFGFGSKDKADGSGSATVTNVIMKVEDDKVDDLYLEFHPRYEASFGDTIGFAKQEYLLTNNTDILSSDTNPIPTAGITENPHPTIIVNVDNLPIKSYIGKRMKADATIYDKPVGNQQGLTKMIGKVPRHHDDNGDGGKTNTGPFYYDYFPYSVALNNATEIVLNELEISVRNPDGTLATDIIEANLLLNISNVESVGESTFGGGIGNPIEAPNSYDRLNVPKGQLQPELRGGFAQSMGSMNEQPARHERSDKGNDLEPMAHL